MPSPNAPIDPGNLAGAVSTLVREAGALALPMFREGAKRWTKADDSPVTEADLAVDRFLAERLPPLVEASGWLSEETADTPDRLGRRHVWVVDPIDGTRAFVEGRPEWVISVALVEDGAPIVGVVYDPCQDVMYSATRGGGATRDGERLAMTDSPTLDGVRAGGPQTLLGPLKAYGVLKGPWHYALANRLVKVADGGLDAALARPRSHDWDIAAAHLVIEEAGGLFTGFDSEPPSYNRPTTRHGGLVAAPPQRHRALLDALDAERETLVALEYL